MDEANTTAKLGILQKLWIRICQFITLIFYRRIEVSGDQQLEQYGPVLLCANHSNALADAVLLQTTTSRLLHPVARSGLFKNPLLKIILTIWQAVPVYRRQDVAENASNQQMFSSVFDMLLNNEIVMLFPEGQSHSDSRLREIKTGAARIALGVREEYGFTPVVIPVGLNFTNKGKFRSSVYINFGEPLEIDETLSIDKESDVLTLTKQLASAMHDVTLNVDQAEDLVFVKQVERFFAFRQSKYRKRNLKQKFRAFKTLIRYQKRLRHSSPELMESLQKEINQFYRLCRRLGVDNYHLTIRYDTKLIAKFILKTIVTLTVIMPLALWGALNAFLPYLATRLIAEKLSHDTDQYDTAKIIIGFFLFSIFWSVIAYCVSIYQGSVIAVLYLVLLMPSLASALYYRREKRLIIDNIKVFFMFLRQQRLRRFLIRRRKRIETDLALLIRQAAKLKQAT